MDTKEKGYIDLKRAKTISIIAVVCLIVFLFLEILLFVDLIKVKTVNFLELALVVFIMTIGIPLAIFYMGYYGNAKKHNEMLDAKENEETKMQEVEEKKIQDTIEKAQKNIVNNDYVCPYCNTIMDANERVCQGCGARRKGKQSR